MTDIIKDAKRLLDGATPGPWVASNNGYIGSTSGVMIHDGQVLGDTAADTELIAAAPEHAETIADMGYEYACQRLLPGTPEDWYTWLTTYSLESANEQIREHAERLRARGYEPQSYRIRRRLVGDWEVVNE